MAGDPIFATQLYWKVRNVSMLYFFTHHEYECNNNVDGNSRINNGYFKKIATYNYIPRMYIQ